MAADPNLSLAVMNIILPGIIFKHYFVINQPLIPSIIGFYNYIV